MPDRVGTFVAIVLLLAFSAVAAASAVTVYPGSVVTLAGTSTGSDTVYFFVTGPNLPSAGGRLEDPATPVRSGDPASFTAVAVGADDRWTYRWRTGEVGLDPGTCIVYVVDAPVDRSNLPGHGYTTVPVPLGLPPGTPATETAAVPTAVPTEPETPTMPTSSPSPTPTAAGTVLVAAHSCYGGGGRIGLRKSNYIFNIVLLCTMMCVMTMGPFVPFLPSGGILKGLFWPLPQPRWRQ